MTSCKILKMFLMNNLFPVKPVSVTSGTLERVVGQDEGLALGWDYCESPCARSSTQALSRRVTPQDDRLSALGLFPQPRRECGTLTPPNCPGLLAVPRLIISPIDFRIGGSESNTYSQSVK